MMMNLPKYHELMWPALVALKSLGGSANKDELLEEIVKIERIPDHILDEMHTDGRQPRVRYALAWALTYLHKCEAIANSSRGVWAITDYGKSLDERTLDKLHTALRKEMGRKAAETRKVRRDGLVEAAESDDAMDVEQEWKGALLDAMKNMAPDAFERLAQRVLRESGFIKVEVLGKSGDGGIDGIGALRINDLLSFQVYFQCKRYARGVGSKEIRDFLGAMVGRGDKGMFITTGNFTQGARKEASRDGIPAIDLIDGELLCDLLKKFSLGVKTEMVEEVTINEKWFEQI